MRARFILFLACAALLIALWPALTGDAILGFRDMLHNYGPMYQLSWSGSSALWNARAFGGSSALGEIGAQPFYLGTLIMRALHANAWPGIPIYLCFHSAGALLAAWALLRRLVSADAAALGAVSFCLCGFSFANMTNLQWSCAAAWVPVVLLAFDLWAERGGLARNALLAVALPQILLAGDPQLCVFTGLAGAALAWQRRRRPVAELLRDGALCAPFISLVAAPQVIAALRLLPASARGAGLSREVREQWSLHPARLAELFVPRLFGQLLAGDFWGSFTVSPPWKRNYVHSIYAGAMGPALVALALLRRRRAAAPWLWLSALVLPLSLGSSFFHLYGIVGEVVPLFSVFRYPQRLMALFMPAWAAFLALGAAELGALPRKQRLALAAAATLLSGAALAATALLAQPDAAAVFRSAIQIALVGAASCAALLLPARLAATALAAVLVFDLTAANAEMLGLLPREPFRGPPAACAALDAASGHAPPFTFRIYVDQEPLESHRPSGWAEQRVREYNFAKRNLAEVCGFREAVALTSVDPREPTQLWREVSPQRMLQVMGTRFAVTRPGRAQLFGGREVSVDERWGFAIAELPAAAPLLFRPGRVEQVPSAQLIAAARARPELLAAGLAALDAVPRAHLPDPSARLLSWADDGDRISFRVRQEKAGYWVLAATLDRDWTAAVDGAPVPIERADLVRRSVWIPAGEHEASLRYRPVLLLGLYALSLLVTLLLGALAARGLLAANHGGARPARTAQCRNELPPPAHSARGAARP